MKTLFFVAGAAALLGAGVWIGRSSSTSEAAPAAQVAAAPQAAPAPRPSARPTPMPALTKPAPSRELLADLEDADAKVRRAAMREVVRKTDADPQLLLKAARDPDIVVGVLAIDALGHMHRDGVVPATELITLASDTSLNERVRLTAINGFGQVQSPESAAYLADRLANGDTFERLNSAILIGHQDLDVAVPALIRALGDSEERVRANALESLRNRSRGRDFGTDAAAWQSWWQSRPR
jgi:HEAT repeat protein